METTFLITLHYNTWKWHYSVCGLAWVLFLNKLGLIPNGLSVLIYKLTKANTPQFKIGYYMQSLAHRMYILLLLCFSFGQRNKQKKKEMLILHTPAHTHTHTLSFYFYDQHLFVLPLSLAFTTSITTFSRLLSMPRLVFFCHCCSIFLNPLQQQ